jgi:hypothetical protein
VDQGGSTIAISPGAFQTSVAGRSQHVTGDDCRQALIQEGRCPVDDPELTRAFAKRPDSGRKAAETGLLERHLEVRHDGAL